MKIITKSCSIESGETNTSLLMPVADLVAGVCRCERRKVHIPLRQMDSAFRVRTNQYMFFLSTY